MYQTHNAKTEG